MRRICLTLSLCALPLAACSNSSNTRAHVTNSSLSRSTPAPMNVASSTFDASFMQVWTAAQRTTRDLGTSDGHRDPSSGRIIVEDASDSDLRIQLTSRGGMTQVQARGESAQFFLQQLQNNLATSSYASVDDN